jgi:hypothetical protein
MATTAKTADGTPTTDAGEGGTLLIELDRIQTDRNVRDLVDEEVAGLAGSIELLGQITPAIVRPAEDGGYVLVAGHKRYAALRKLGRSQIRAEVRSAEAEHSERAAENVVRSQLNPYEPGTIAADATLSTSIGCDGPRVRGEGVIGVVRMCGGFPLQGAVFVGRVRIRCNIVAVSSDAVLACG